jgi:glyoxylase-like metal-dependent hydrolase (beta-lactamase superfamily II)
MQSILLPAGNASSWTGPTGTNTYLLTGAVPALVDAGIGDPAHVEAIAASLGGVRLARVLITHGHTDHVSGLDALRERWTPLFVFDPRDPEIVRTQGSQRIAAGDGYLMPIHTPGHSPEHFCFLDESAGDVYCGDLARANGTIVIPGRRGGNLRQYLESLTRIRDLRPRRLLPGHGPIVTDPASLIEGYLAHRADREAQVIDALRRRPATAEEIAPEIYGRLSDGIEAAAEETVYAHLMKLKEDGLALRGDDGKWSMLDAK